MPLTGIDSGYRKYLLPQVIAKLSNLELIAKLVVEGFITGLHKSPYHGFSVEFAEMTSDTSTGKFMQERTGITSSSMKKKQI